MDSFLKGSASSSPTMRALGLFRDITPAAEGHGLWLWMNASRQWTGDVAPLEREVGYHGLCPWGSTITLSLL
jgi:hypothetical protein